MLEGGRRFAAEVLVPIVVPLGRRAARSRFQIECVFSKIGLPDGA